MATDQKPQSSSSTAAKKSAKSAAPTSTEVRSPDAPGFGWTRYSEQVNGRFAMVGFVALLVLELFTRQDIYTWLGLR